MTRSRRWSTPWKKFDPVGQRAAKAIIFRERVIAPRAPRLGADTPADALAICLDTRGEVRLDEIARLLGTTEDDAREQLGTLVFDDPAPGGWCPPPSTCPGTSARSCGTPSSAAEDDPAFAVNVTELRRVIPPDLTPGEIDARLGAAWIDATYVQQFLREILDDPRPAGRASRRADLGGTRQPGHGARALDLGHQPLPGAGTGAGRARTAQHRRPRHGDRRCTASTVRY